MSIRKIFPVLLLAIGLFLNQSSANELPLPTQPHIVVEGVGEVEQIPDIITLHLQVSETAQTFSAAKQQVDAIVAKAIKVAKKFGVKTDDINASKIQAAPQYEWQNQQRIYKGERIDRLLVIRSTQPGSYNDLVEGLLGAGVSRLQQIELQFSNRKALEDQALELALQDAKHRAQVIVGQLNTHLQTIYQVAPEPDAPVITPYAMAAAEQSKGGAPLQLGKQTVRQRVRVVYLLAQ